MYSAVVDIVLHALHAARARCPRKPHTKAQGPPHYSCECQSYQHFSRKHERMLADIPVAKPLTYLMRCRRWNAEVR